MILQVDAGNSRFHWRCLDSERQPIADPGARGAAFYQESADWPDADDVERIELASVAGQEKHRWLLQELERLGSATVHEAVSQPYQCGVRNSYPEPGQMGVDRWLTMIAAHSLYPGGVVVVDAGTAVTVDYVDSKGDHLGGYILPGLSMMLGSLDRDTGRVSVSRQLTAGAEPGTSTGACVNAGVAWLWQAMAAQLEGDRQRLQFEWVVLTGGDAPRLAAASPDGFATCPELLFLGMDLYWGC